MLPKPASAVCLQQHALDWALKHLTRFGDTVFLPKAFEYDAILEDWKSLSDWLTSQDMRDLEPRPYRRLLAVKTQGSFRYVTQLDPLEHLAFAGLMYGVGQELEASRLPTAAQTVFSWRFAPQPDGTMYDPLFRWKEFNLRCRELAERKTTKFVVVADIADFFPHLYLHPVERTLERCTKTREQAYCVLRMLKGWNARVSHGIPVGPPSGRIVADATLTDLDKALIGRGVRYCRYSDDFRIFCRSEPEARSLLEFLAETLFETYGLTLQAAKTLIEVAEYLKRFALSADRLEAESLEEKFHLLLEQAGWESVYEKEIECDDLPEDVRVEIDKLNLAELFRGQLTKERYDPVVVSLLLQGLGQLDHDELVDDIMANMAKLEPVVDAVVAFLIALRSLSDARRCKIGRRILSLATNRRASRYQVACLLNVFTHDREFDNEDSFERAFEKVPPKGREN